MTPTVTGTGCRIDPEWSWALRAVAEHGGWLQFMTPCDVDAFQTYANAEFSDVASLDGHALLRLWVVGVLKWPRAVEEWGKAMAAWRPSAKGYVDALVSVAGSIEDEPMEWTHEQISGGNQNLWFGPAALLRRLGIASETGQAESRDSGTALLNKLKLGFTARPAVGDGAAGVVTSGPESESPVVASQTLPPQPSDHQLAEAGMSPGEGRQTSAPTDGQHIGSDIQMQARMGRGRGKNFLLSTSLSAVLQALVTAADRMLPCALPVDDPNDCRRFIDAVGAFFCSFPSSLGMGTPEPCGTGTAQADKNYVRKNIVRKILLWVKTLRPLAAWDSLTVADMAACLPDKHGHLAILPRTLTARQLRRTFGVDGFMVSCWACLAGGVMAKHRRLFFARWPRIRRSLPPSHPPCPQLLAGHFTSLLPSFPRLTPFWPPNLRGLCRSSCRPSLEKASYLMWKRYQELTLENGGVQPNLATLAKSLTEQQPKRSASPRVARAATKPKRRRSSRDTNRLKNEPAT